MSRSARADAANSLLGKAQFFVSALSEVIDAKVLRDIAGKDLTLYQLQLLRLVSLQRKHSIGGLAAHFGVSSPAVSKAVDRLVKKMYLRRVEGERDRRIVDLSLTAIGRRVLERFDESRTRMIEKLFGRLPVDELQRAAELLQRMTALIVAVGPDPDDPPRAPDSVSQAPSQGRRSAGT
jgi:DNA-binding MarR family transcriptional regulator